MVVFLHAEPALVEQLGGAPLTCSGFGAKGVGRSKGLRFLGDVSYALYLCHYFAIGLTRAVWPRDALKITKRGPASAQMGATRNRSNTCSTRRR